MPGGGCQGHPAPGPGGSLDWSSRQAPDRPRTPGTGPGKSPSPGLVAIASVAPSPPRARQPRRGVKDGAKKWAGPCQATQVVPFYGHAAAGGTWEPGPGGADVKSRSRARTQLFPSPAPCGVLAPQEDRLPPWGAKPGSCLSPLLYGKRRVLLDTPRLPRQPGAGRCPLTPPDPSCPCPPGLSPMPPPRAPLELGREETPSHRLHLPVRAPRHQLQHPFLLNKSIIVEPGTTASSLPRESWGQNPLCKEALRPRGARPVVARPAGVLVGRLAFPSPTPHSGSGASRGWLVRSTSVLWL